jgi:hypothetical protein
MKRCKNERKWEQFVWEVVGAYNDIISFCCVDHPNNCVLGLYITFNLGKFYVRITVYQHLALEDQSGMHPLFLGPLLVHQCKLYSSYKQLLQGLHSTNPATKLIKAFDTDDEVN